MGPFPGAATTPPGPIPTSTLQSSPLGSALSHQAFVLAISEFYNIVALPGSMLRVLYKQKPITLEMVMAENRLWAGEQIDFVLANGLD